MTSFTAVMKQESDILGAEDVCTLQSALGPLLRHGNKKADHDVGEQ